MPLVFVHGVANRPGPSWDEGSKRRKELFRRLLMDGLMSNSSGLSWADEDRCQYGYDRGGNRLYKENTLQSTLSELYHDGSGYDKFDRLGQFSRGTLNGTKDGLTGSASASRSARPPRPTNASGSSSCRRRSETTPSSTTATSRRNASC